MDTRTIKDADRKIERIIAEMVQTSARESHASRLGKQCARMSHAYGFENVAPHGSDWNILRSAWKQAASGAAPGEDARYRFERSFRLTMATLAKGEK